MANARKSEDAEALKAQHEEVAEVGVEDAPKPAGGADAKDAVSEPLVDERPQVKIKLADDFDADGPVYIDPPLGERFELTNSTQEVDPDFAATVVDHPAVEVVD